MHTTILTLFPEMFPATLGAALAGKALSKGLWGYDTLNIRDFATDKHQSVDGKSYGGGSGLVMRADVLGAAIDAAQKQRPDVQLIFPSPRGVPFTQAHAVMLAEQDSIFLCGRYEGVDQRIIEHYQPLEVSLGDYILSGGELAVQVMLDAAIRHIPGVIGGEVHRCESFSQTKLPLPSLLPPLPLGEGRGEGSRKNNKQIKGKDRNSSALTSFLSARKLAEKACLSQRERVPLREVGGNPHISARLLEYPHYTAPPQWNGMAVPEVLLSGDHAKIETWRLDKAIEITKEIRPDLLGDD